jgi:predicted SnoaL-like aldol condensation-catalyzing enzyme
MICKTGSLVLLAALALLPACGHAPAQTDAAASTSAQEEQNKKTVLAFYQAAINDKDFEAASVYMGQDYIQHNPMAATGPEGLKAFLEFAREETPGFKVEFKRAFADGDYVIIHAHATNGPEDRGSAVMDIFRLEGGKVVEHWDVIQPIPEDPRNQNTMF